MREQLAHYARRRFTPSSVVTMRSQIRRDRAVACDPSGPTSGRLLGGLGTQERGSASSTGALGSCWEYGSCRSSDTSGMREHLAHIVRSLFTRSSDASGYASRAAVPRCRRLLGGCQLRDELIDERLDRCHFDSCSPQVCIRFAHAGWPRSAPIAVDCSPDTLAS